MLYCRPIISLPFRGFDLKIILTAGLLLYFQATVAQLVEDDAIMGVLTDHTGGYLGTGVSFADFNGDGKDDLSFGHHISIRHYVSI